MGNFNRGGSRNDGSRGGGFRSFDGPREMHKTTCSECKKECEVPFKPAEGRPVYCKDCFMKSKGITPRGKSDEDESEEGSEESEEESVEDSEDF